MRHRDSLNDGSVTFYGRPASRVLRKREAVGRYCVEYLEPRRLLSSAVFGPYASAATLPANLTGFNIAPGDFNNDGKTDYVVSTSTGSPYSTTLEVLLSNGDGTFQSSTLSVPAYPAALAVGDFNGDGNADIAVASYTTNTVSFFYGNGNGTFGPRVDVNLDPGAPAFTLEPFSMTTGDFNGDGKLDLAVANGRADTVTILENTGNSPNATATFSQSTLATNSEPTGIVSGDFNGDGKTDLAVSEFGANDVNIFLGNGDGTFTSGGTYATASQPYGLAAGDFNGDGRTDLAVACRDAGGTSYVSVLLANSDGSFSPSPSGRDYAVSTLSDSVAVGDFNGDGHLDFAAAGQSGNTVTVWQGNGDGTFANSQTLPLPANTDPNVIVAGDFNGDGKPDLALVGATSTVGVIANDSPANGRAVISGTIYSDPTGLGLNAAGTPAGSGDAGQSQVLVTLSQVNNDGSTAVVSSVRTDNNGNYTFNNVLPGTYFVQEQVPGGDTQTGGSAGYTVTVASGDASTGDSFSNFLPATISGTAYSDPTGLGLNANGTPASTSDSVQSGVAIIVLQVNNDGSTTQLTTARTESNGNYTFSNILPGTYLIQEQAPGGNTQTGAIAGYTIRIGNPSSTYTNAISTNVGSTTAPNYIAGGGADTGNNFSNFLPVTISGTAYSDPTGLGLNANGTPASTSDSVQSGVAIIVLQVNNDGSTTQLTTARTDSNGNYTFSNILPGTYLIQEQAPGGNTQTGAIAGYTIRVGNPSSTYTDAISSNVGSTTAPNYIAGGGADTGNNFSNFLPVTISGTVYSDPTGLGLNANGTPASTSDSVQSGVAIIVLQVNNDGSTTQLTTARTESNGNYTFSNILPGTYLIQEQAPGGNTQTGAIAGYTIRIGNPSSTYTNAISTNVGSTTAPNYIAGGGADTGNNFSNSPPAPTITNIAGAAVVYGSGNPLTDSAVVSGGASPTGSITFNLFNASNSIVYTDVVSVSGASTYTTATGNNRGGYLPASTGTYHWVAAYSGDANNGAVSTPVGAAQVIVKPISNLVLSVTNTLDSGPGALRQAILTADGDIGGANTINFAIPGTLLHTITPLTPLPAITVSTIINGETQPGYVASSTSLSAPLIDINGAGMTGAGLTLAAGSSSSTIEGLTINGFSAAQISIASGSAGDIIAGNYLGTNSAGTAAAAPGTGAAGILIASSSNTIGGFIAAARNIISGNQIGVEIASGSRNLIEGNYIGTNAAGTAGVGNTFAGVEILDAASNNMIGGGSAGASNLIAYNGTLGNAGSGGVIIGDSATATIPVGNALEYNSIFSNNGLGILLGTGGANNAIAAPTIASVTTVGSSTTITLHVTQAVGSKVRIELYSSASNATGQGQTLLIAGAGITVPARAVVNGVTQSYSVIPATIPALRGTVYVTATLTDATNDTSAFSSPVLG